MQSAGESYFSSHCSPTALPRPVRRGLASPLLFSKVHAKVKPFRKECGIAALTHILVDNFRPLKL